MNSPRVLIVDDNAMNATIAQVVLLADRFDIEIAVNAAEALQKLAWFQPELILMDVQMPGMNGLELAGQLKSDPSTNHICIVAFTAFAMRGDEVKMRAAGCDGYLSKPINVKTFAAQVRSCLAGPTAPPLPAPLQEG